MTERGAAQPGHATPDALKRTLTEHAAPERLVVARGLFTGPSAAVTDDMYARIVNGRAHRERYALHLEKGATVDTNTYFGRLPASYFQRWTTAGEVQQRLVFDTSTRARVLLRGSDIQMPVHLTRVGVEHHRAPTLRAKPRRQIERQAGLARRRRAEERHALHVRS